MTPTTPLATTLALRDQITESFQFYQSSKTKFALPVVLGMLAAVAGICVRFSFSLSINYLRLIWFFMQNQIANCGDPAIFTDHSITEAIFTVRQEYNNLNNADKSVTDPAGFKEVRDYLKKVQVIRDAAEAQKQGAADVAAALADVKPKVRAF
jgi:hypothetical protein